MLVLGAADEPHRGHPETAIVQGLLRGVDDAGIVGQAQVVVGTEVQHLLRVGADRSGPDLGRLGRGDGPLRLEQTAVPQLLEFGLEVIAHRGEHRDPYVVDVLRQARVSGSPQWRRRAFLPQENTVQSSTTLPLRPSAAIWNPRSQSVAGSTSVITEEIVRCSQGEEESIAAMAFHVSNISRP